MPAAKRTPKKRTVTITAKAAKQMVLEAKIEVAKRTLARPSTKNICKAVRCSPNAVASFNRNGTCKRRDYKAKPRNTAKCAAVTKRRAFVKQLAQTRVTKESRVLVPYKTCKSMIPALKQAGITVCVETVRTDLHAEGMHHWVCPSETVYSTDRAMAARETFVGQERWTDDAVLESLIFSDETYIDVNDHSHPAMWADSRDELVPRERKNVLNCTRVMLWAAIGIGWHSELVFFDKCDEDGKIMNMTAATYKRRCLVPNRNALKGKLFIQDGASSHRSRDVLKYLDNQGILYVKDWPASSPRYNMIESVWAELKRRLSDFGPTKDMEHFKANARKAWEDMGETFDNFCRKFGKVVAADKALFQSKAAVAADAAKK